jgi:glyoxylase-like metal-dependent hydrolase (beta-lactamase superfamily II)
MEPRPIDVRHLGRERVICCWQVGDVLIDPGPESAMGTLVEALGDRPPRVLLLTHIHLDHAGAAGSLVRRWPHLEVYVHERGATHLADPSSLLESARRLYGDDLDRLWGEVAPVPEDRLRPLSGGETVEGFEVVYTPGHASHHVAYLDGASRRAYVGDTAGVRIEPADLVLPPTPPPDIDLEAWNQSLSALADWGPQTLAITHFGMVEPVFEHLAVVRDRLAAWATLARELDGAAFEAHIRSEIAEAADPETGAALAQAVPPDQQWLGLERYWTKRGDG